MRVIADSSSLIALAVCDALLLLDELFEDVRVPEAVRDEVVVEDKPAANLLARYLDGRVVRASADALEEQEAHLGRGEREALALCREQRADLLLADDQQARAAAQSQGFALAGSLGVLLRAKERGLVEEIRPYLNRLRASEVYVAESLLQQMLEEAGEQ